MQIRSCFAAALLAATSLVPAAQAANHREAPLTALDRTADITDWYAFVSPDRPSHVTMILSVDPLLEPSNGPNYFPFDDGITYQMRVDNDRDARADLTFEFKFNTEITLPGVPVGVIGAGRGINAPENSPAPVAPGTPLIPQAVTALNGPGASGLVLRQSYTVSLIRENGRRTLLGGSPNDRLFAVPSNVGPRTMPNYRALFASGIYNIGQNDSIRVFAGTTDDPFYIDLGATFDSLNFRPIPGPGATGVPAVMSAAQDVAKRNFVSDDVSGFNVNTIAIQVPITLLTADGGRPTAIGARNAVIGTWGVTLRNQNEIRAAGRPIRRTGPLSAVQRMGNPLINELIIGTGDKDRFSRSNPAGDSAFASYFLDPLLPRVTQAAYGGAFDIPAPNRTDLLPLVTYAPPLTAAGSPAGPIADLLRLNVAVPPTPLARANRLGFIAGDSAGFPNGRRPIDDVTDIALRVVVGGVLAPGFNVAPNNALGDGVNVNPEGLNTTFPYVQPANSGRSSRHIDAGEIGCAGSACPR